LLRLRLGFRYKRKILRGYNGKRGKGGGFGGWALGGGEVCQDRDHHTQTYVDAANLSVRAMGTRTREAVLHTKM